MRRARGFSRPASSMKATAVPLSNTITSASRIQRTRVLGGRAAYSRNIRFSSGRSQRRRVLNGWIGARHR